MYDLFRLSLVLLFTGCLAGLLGPRATAEDSVKPNVLVILVDDMGYGDAGCYNRKSRLRTLIAWPVKACASPMHMPPGHSAILRATGCSQDATRFAPT